MKLSEHTNSETELCGVPAYTHTRSHTHAPPILGKEKKKQNTKMQETLPVALCIIL